MDKFVNLFMKKLKDNPYFYRVKFVILFGSRSKQRSNILSDYDFAVYFQGSGEEKFKLRKYLNFDKKIDAHIFQDLPLNIQKEVLKGKIIFTSDLDFVYDVAYLTIKKFEDFRKYYYDYINMEPLA